jgi:hypothetical protein
VGTGGGAHRMPTWPCPCCGSSRTRAWSNGHRTAWQFELQELAPSAWRRSRSRDLDPLPEPFGSSREVHRSLFHFATTCGPYVGVVSPPRVDDLPSWPRGADGSHCRVSFAAGGSSAHLAARFSQGAPFGERHKVYGEDMLGPGVIGGISSAVLLAAARRPSWSPLAFNSSTFASDTRN